MLKTKRLTAFSLITILLLAVSISVISQRKTVFADELQPEETGYNYLETENIERQVNSFVENGILAAGTDDFYNFVRYDANSKNIDKFYFNDRIYSTGNLANTVQNSLEDLQVQPNSLSDINGTVPKYLFETEPYKSICYLSTDSGKATVF